MYTTNYHVLGIFPLELHAAGQVVQNPYEHQQVSVFRH